MKADHARFQHKMLTTHPSLIYRTARKLGRGIQLKLVVWRFTLATAKLKSTNIHTHITYMYGNPIPKDQIQTCQYLYNGVIYS